MDGIHGADQRLNSQEGGPALEVDAQAAGDEKARGDGGAQRAGRGIAGEDGPSHAAALATRRHLTRRGYDKGKSSKDAPPGAARATG